MNTGTMDLAGLADTLEGLRRELARLSERVAALEQGAGQARPADGTSANQVAPAAAGEELSEELLLVLGAAVAAFLGKKAHIRQIRVLSSAGWAQQGRVTVQASHALEGRTGEEIAVKLKITVDGKVYEVEVEVFEPEMPHLTYVPPPGQARVPAAAPGPAPATPPPAQSSAAPVADEGKVCRSPIAGTVARVPIQVGQAIHVNDVLMVLEAMKMETVITAPIAGKVARINAKVGDFVQGGQILVEFE